MAVDITITNQPVNDTVDVGDTAEFFVTASGGTALTYQWYKNTIAIPGATAPDYETPAVALTDSGASFFCIVTDDSGTLQSATATLTVNSALQLASLNMVKNYLRVPLTETGLDTILTQILQAVSQDCETFCDRIFTAGTYTERIYEAGLGRVLTVKNYPVDLSKPFIITQFSQVGGFDFEIPLTTAPEVVSSDFYTVNKDNGVIYFLDETQLGRGTQTVEIQYTAGYPVPTGAAADAYTQVPLDLAQSVVEMVAAKYRRQTGAIDAKAFKDERDLVYEKWLEYQRTV